MDNTIPEPVQPVIRTKVTYDHPGSLFSETSRADAADRDPQRAAREAPDSAFSFQFYDSVTATVRIDGQEITLTGQGIRRSCRYFIDAEILTVEQVEALPGDTSILAANMRGNGWWRVVRCRTGNFQPFDDSDQIVRTDEHP